MDANPTRCAECGSALPRGLLGGLCPRCLASGVAAEDLLGAGASADEIAPDVAPETDSDLRQVPGQGEPAAEGDRPDRPRSGTHFRLGRVLGEGGMGVVYEAHDRKIGRTVAVKRLRPNLQAQPQALARFAAEVRIAGQLEHAGIVPVYEAGMEGANQPYYSMRRIQGTTLAALLERIKKGDANVIARYPLPELLTILQKACDAVAYAHSRQVIHRDLKPENIMVGEFGEVLVMDWGLAKVLDAPESPELRQKAVGRGQNEEEDAGVAREGRLSPASIEAPPDRPPQLPPGDPASNRAADQGHRPVDKPPGEADGGAGRTDGTPGPVSAPSLRTMAGTVLGTPGAMAPEQAAGQSAAGDVRTDVFGLGGVLYRILTLRAPAGGSTVREVLGNTRRGYIPPPVYYQKEREVEADGVTPAEPVRLAHLPGGRVPGALSAMAMTALAVLPDARYQTVKEFQTDLAAYQAGFVTSVEDANLWRLLVLFVRRHKPLAAAAGIVLLMAVVFAWQVVRERNRAEATVVEMRKVLRTQVEHLILARRFEEALAKVDYVLSLTPKDAEWRLMQANLLQVLLRFDKAEASYRVALQSDRAGPAAAENLGLCRKLGQRQLAGQPLTEADYGELYAAMDRQGRYPEAAALLKMLGDKTSARRQALLASWKERLRQAGVAETELGSLIMDEEGFLSLHNEGVVIKDFGRLQGMPFRLIHARGTPALTNLEVFRGMPIEALEVGDIPLVSDLRPLTGMHLKTLNLAQTQVTNLAPLQGMPLEGLVLYGTDVVDLSPLHGMPLRQLDLVGCQKISDLGPLRGMPLRWLRIQGEKLKDLTPLRGMKLEDFKAGWCGFTNLGPLEGMALKTLEIHSSPRFKDLTPLRGMPIVELNIYKTGVTDLTVLSNMPLKSLDFGGTSVRDMSPLKGLALEVLLFGGTAVADLRALAGMPLKRLAASSTQVGDLEPLRGCPLAELDLRSSLVKDVAPLAGMPLKVLHLSGTTVTNLQPLASLPLEDLSLDGTPVSDIGPLRGRPLKRLRLDECRFLQDLSPLGECKELEYLTIPRTGLKIELLRTLPKLKKLGASMPEDNWDKVGSAAEFWSAYDARHRAN